MHTKDKVPDLNINRVEYSSMIEDWFNEFVVAAVAAFAGWCLRMYTWMRDLIAWKDSHKVDEDLILALLREQRAQTHYMKWMAENITGNPPPPYLED